ncbi:MAG: hypothetical protein V4579_06045 [Pseudomonadota bacterium]
MHQFKPTDHLRHPAGTDGRMRDSLFWQTVIPEERLCFQTYLYLTAAGNVGLNIALWGGTEEEKFKTYEFVQAEVPETMDLDNFSFDGFSLNKVAFGGPAKVTFAGSKIRTEFEFTGLHEPFSYHDNPDGLPNWMAADRYEQSGRIKGFIEAGGRRIELDRMGHRDHSWGIRSWGMPQHWKWFCAYTPDGSITLNGWFWVARGEYGCAGYVVKDGELSAIAHMRPKAGYDPDMSQRRMEVDIHDVAGRVTRLEFERFGNLRLPSGDKLGTIIQEAGCFATIDGHEGSGQFETHWQQSYIDHLKDAGLTA